MADRYVAEVPPEEYSPIFFVEELRRIEEALAYLEVPSIRLIPHHVDPFRALEGEVRNADGSDWNPGGGAGLYQYLSGSWTKL